MKKNKATETNQNTLTSPEIAAKLRKDFPELYQNVYCGLDCPTGWFTLVYELSQNIQGVIDIARKAGIKTEVKVAQVKQKLSGLRYYIDISCKNENISEAINAMISRAENRSFQHCELCGDYGSTLNNDGWLVGRCKKHEKTSWSKYEEEIEKNRKSNKRTAD